MFWQVLHIHGVSVLLKSYHSTLSVSGISNLAGYGVWKAIPFVIAGYLI